MVQRLFLDRIDAEPGRPTVRGQDQPVPTALAHETGAPLSFLQLAFARAQVALQAPVSLQVPVTRRGSGGQGFGGSDHFCTV